MLCGHSVSFFFGAVFLFDVTPFSVAKKTLRVLPCHSVLNLFVVLAFPNTLIMSSRQPYPSSVTFVIQTETTRRIPTSVTTRAKRWCAIESNPHALQSSAWQEIWVWTTTWYVHRRTCVPQCWNRCFVDKQTKAARWSVADRISVTQEKSLLQSPLLQSPFKSWSGYSQHPGLYWGTSAGQRGC